MKIQSILFSICLLLAGAGLQAEDSRLSAVRSVLASQRHTDATALMHSIRKVVADPRPYLRTIAVETHSYAYIRMRAVDLLSEFPGDPDVLAFLEARLADPEYALRKYALRSLVRGYTASHTNRVAAVLSQCANHDADSGMRRLASGMLARLRAGKLSTKRQRLPHGLHSRQTHEH